MNKKGMLFSIVIGLAGYSAFAATTDAPVKYDDVDTDKNGLISRQEAASFAAVELKFEEADTDMNGSLDWNEFAAGGSPGEFEVK